MKSEKAAPTNEKGLTIFRGTKIGAEKVDTE
jgi:hypothetical protein